MQRLNAAFDAMADLLMQRADIRTLARRHSVAEIYAFEMRAGDLGRQGDLCFLVRWASSDAWQQQIGLHKDLSARLGLRPHLFDYQAFDQADRESLLEKAISL